jgi:hypothetical protein
MDVVILMSAGMKFGNKKKFRYGIPVCDDPFRALHISNCFRFRAALKRKQCDPLKPWHLHTSSNGVTKQKTISSPP